uniref:Uncharacterized protein n=1 Tax=Solanum tuberosum TaxID=4113 RepID=M1CYU3_SOLTU
MTAKKVINRKLVKVGIEIICFGKLIALHVFLFTHKCIALIEFRGIQDTKFVSCLRFPVYIPFPCLLFLLVFLSSVEQCGSSIATVWSEAFSF